MIETQTIIHHCAPPCTEAEERITELKAHYKALGYKVSQDTSHQRILMTARKTISKRPQ